ncbi:MAG: sigma-70 family RNA polymerase sigma factor [Planctomycetaceae bacterium]|nr:sigma-70 family RNA polymerase sigma factor [Planctomycetaceae bacterium]
MSTSLSLLNQLQDASTPHAWDRLQRIYEPLIRKWLRAYDIQESDAEDLLQETLLAISKDIGAFDHNGRAGAFRAWVKGILVNRLRKFWRSRDRGPSVQGGSDMQRRLAELDDPSSGVTLIWNKEHDERVLRELLAMVKPHFTESTWLAFCGTTFEGRKPQQVAGELGISLNAVVIAKSRVINRLRQEADGMIETSSGFPEKP